MIRINLKTIMAYATLMVALITVVLPTYEASDLESIQRGVDLVTRLSNNLVPTVFKDLTDKQADVFGPFGLATNLAMLLEASQGKTRQELLKVLNLFLEDVGDMRLGFRAYCELFVEHSAHPEASGSFNTASLSTSATLQASYLNVLSKHYCANVSESTSAEDQNTFNLGSDTGVLSHWKDFEKLAVYTFLSHQSLLPFTKKDGTKIQVPMVPQVGVFRTVRWGTSLAVLLPLEAKLVHMLLILPDTMADMDLALSRLSNDTIIQLVQTMPREELEVFIPQMTIISKAVNVVPVLRQRGMRLVFDNKKADLSRAFEKNLKIHVRSIAQDAYFSTSFNSINSVAGISSSLGARTRTRRDTRKIFIDKPFIFFILHRDTQLVLLAGKIENPAQVPFSNQTH